MSEKEGEIASIQQAVHTLETKVARQEEQNEDLKDTIGKLRDDSAVCLVYLLFNFARIYSI